MTVSLAVWWRGILGAGLCVGTLLGTAAGLTSTPMGAWSIGAIAAAGAALLLWWAQSLLTREALLRAEMLRELHKLQRFAGGEPDEAGGSRDLRLAARQAEGTIVAIREQAAARLGDLRSLLDAVEDAVIAFDSNGFVRLTNAAADGFFERAEGGLLGHSIEELFSQADVISLYSDAARGKPSRGQVRFVRPGGVRTYLVAAAPFSLTAEPEPPNRDRRPVAMILEDVSEFAASVQHKTEFVANASHELRTPLASIRGAAETLMDGETDPGMSKRLLDMITTNARRLEELVSDLSDLSRLESPEAAVMRVTVSLREICQSVAALFERVCAERALVLKFEIAPEVERIETDPRLLALILKNLIENATKFAHESTPILVTAEPIRGPRRDGVRLQVVDRGIGIPLSAQPRIFERFYQVDASRSGQSQSRGTGLGLAIVKHAVKSLGGSVAVASVWKEGTTMTVELPACLPDGGPADPDTPPSPKAGHSPAIGA